MASDRVTLTHTDYPPRYVAEPQYEKCAHCHLFVVPNDDHKTDPALAAYDHLHRGDAADEAIISTHDAAPSGEIHNLDWRINNGPDEMLDRFKK